MPSIVAGVPDLQDKVALITGSSSGIGAAIASALAGAGARVVINSATSVRAGQELASRLAEATYIQGDIADPAQARSLVDATVEQYGRLDVLVNNAGTTEVIPHHDLDAVTEEIWQRILGVNVIGTFKRDPGRRSPPA